MKKLFALMVLTALIFTFGCTSNADDSDDTNDNQDDKIYPDYECISSATAVYAGCNRTQTGEISVSLKVGHVWGFAENRNLDPENSEFNNIAITRFIHSVELKPGSLLGEISNDYSEEIVYKIDDYLSDKYDFNTVQRSADWLTVDKFRIELDDGVYFVNYIIGVYNDSGEVDYSKLVWGTDPAQFYIEKTGGSFKLYTDYEWWLKSIGKL